MQNTHQDEADHEPSTHNDHDDKSVHSDDVGSFTTQLAVYYNIIFYVQSTPPVPPRLNYAELQLAIVMDQNACT